MSLSALQHLSSQPSTVNRRSFLTGLGGAAALAALSEGTPAQAQNTTFAITDLLNFVLNVEYLEANLFLYATTGAGLSSTDKGGSTAAVTGLAKLTLDATTSAVAQALAADETHHVQLLRSTITSLGGTPVIQPAINLAPKTAMTTQAQFLIAARQLTALSGAVYAGMAHLLTANPPLLSTFTQLLGAEGQHDGALNYLCVTQNINSPAIDGLDITTSATNYFTVQTTTALSPASPTGLALTVMYGVATASTIVPPVTATLLGGYFPAGMNGVINSTLQ